MAPYNMLLHTSPQIARFMGQHGADLGPMLAPWTLLSGTVMIGVEYELEFELKTDTPNLTLTGKLWGFIIRIWEKIYHVRMALHCNWLLFGALLFTHIYPFHGYVTGTGMITMMTSSNGNIFCVTDPLCGEFTSDRWIPCTKATDVEI